MHTHTNPGRVSGHVYLAKRKRGDVWFARYGCPTRKCGSSLARLGPGRAARLPAT